MSQPIIYPSDDAIERALASRAPHRPDATLLGGVMAAVHATGQVSRRGATLRDPIGGVRRPLVWAALAAVLLVAGALAVSVGSNPPTFPAQVTSPPAATLPAAAVPSSSPASTPSASAETCATQTTSVVTGDAMPVANAKPMNVPADVLEVGVYLTGRADASPLDQVDAWAIRAGEAIRIASIVGPDFNQARVDAISPDGRTALIGIGVIHGGLPGPMCSDLYTVRTDGSGATRLTFKGPDAFADGGSFSHDGRYVAFASNELLAVSPAIGLVDLQGDATEHDFLCDGASSDLHIAWSPADDRLAAMCGSTVMIIGVGGSPAGLDGAARSYQFPVDDMAFVGVTWQDRDRILVVTAAGGQSSNGPIDFTTLTLGRGASGQDGTWSRAVPSNPGLNDAGLSTGIALAPDGHSVAFYGDPNADDPQGDTLALYAADAATGVAQYVAPWATSDVGWSSDSASLVYVDLADDRTILTSYDLAARAGHQIGSMASGYRGGIWRAR